MQEETNQINTSPLFFFFFCSRLKFEEAFFFDVVCGFRCYDKKRAQEMIKKSAQETIKKEKEKKNF